MIRKNEVEKILREHGMTAEEGFFEKLGLRVLEEVLDAVHRAKEEGRKVLQPSDIFVRNAQGERVAVPKAGEMAKRPLVERQTSRLCGLLKVVERVGRKD